MIPGGVRSPGVATADGTAADAGEGPDRRPLALTSEELAVMAERHHGSLSPMLAPDLGTDDMVVASVVAARSLLARGLATVDDAGLRLTASVYDRLEPVLRARVTVEVTLSLPGSGSARSAHVIVDGDDRVILLDEREPGVWVATERHTDLVGAVRSLIDDGATEGTVTVDRPSVGRQVFGWTVSQHDAVRRRLVDLLTGA